tara:strand:- start:1984 stop:4230 length:2247 start_codon:yes stop_codon:yes gene_type:complete
MQKIRVPQNSFQFGEVSDSLIMRTDTGIYTSSAQKIENMIVTAEGSARKRQGLKHIYDYSITYNSSYPDQSHLFPFIFDNNEQYIISVEHQKVRCFRVVDADTVSLVTTLTTDASGASLPFDREYLQQYTAAQMGDVMFICHPLFAPRILTRTGLTSFTVSTYTFDERADGKKTYQPYSKFHGVGVTLNPGASGGSGSSVTLTTSSAYFDTTGSQSGGNYPNSLHVGVIIRYHGNELQITSVQSSTQAIGTVSDELQLRLDVANPLRTRNGSTTVEVTHINHGYDVGEALVFSGMDTVGGITATNLNGTRAVLSVIDDNTYTFTADAAATSSEDGGGNPLIQTHAPTTTFDEQSWSAKRGYPAAVAFHENRLVFAGTIAEPDSIYMSKIGEYFNHDVGTAQDNEAIQLTAATGDVHEIRHLVSSRDLQVFAGTGELYVPTYLNQAITPTNAQIREQTPYGCAFATPQLIDGATVFSQASGRIVREYLFTDNEDAYASTAISTIASHLINTPKYMAVAHSGFEQADSYIIMSMTDGDAAVFTSNRAEKRASWTEFTTNGRFDSVVAIDDRLFANIYDANNKLKLCEFKTDIGLDSYIYGAISSNSITVSSAYANGVTVDVVATSGSQNDYLGEFTVASGAVDLSAFSTAGYTHAYVGKKFTSKIISNPIDASGAAGPLTGSLRGITNVVVDIKDTRSIKVNTKPINIETSFTGKKEVRLIGYDRDPKVTIEQDNPLSMQVNGFITEVII